MTQEKRKKSVRFTADNMKIIEDYMAENECDFTQAVNELLQKQNTDTDKIVNAIMTGFDTKYKNLFERLRLGVAESDKNIQLILELWNSYIFSEKKNISLMPTSAYEVEVITEGREEIKEKISGKKQKVDWENKKKKTTVRKELF